MNVQALRSLRHSRLFPYALLATAVLLWGGTWVFARGLRADVPPVALAFWRWVIALVILSPFAYSRVRAQRRMIAGSWPLLAWLALLVTVLQHIPIYIGLRETTATNGALLNSVTPVVIVILSRLLIGERLTLVQALGVAASLGGVIVIVARGDPGVLATLELNRGDLWILLATVAWGFYTVCLRWRPAGLDALALLWTIAIFGVIAMLPLYAWELAVGRVINPTPPALLGLAYMGVFGTVVAYVFWNRAVHEVGPNRAGPFMNLMLVYTPLLAIIFLGERLHVYHFTGCALILGGIYLTAAGRAREVREANVPNV